jgi:hypothetical protein
MYTFLNFAIHKEIGSGPELEPHHFSLLEPAPHQHDAAQQNWIKEQHCKIQYIWVTVQYTVHYSVSIIYYFVITSFILLKFFFKFEWQKLFMFRNFFFV